MYTRTYIHPRKRTQARFYKHTHTQDFYIHTQSKIHAVLPTTGQSRTPLSVTSTGIRAPRHSRHVRQDNHLYASEPSRWLGPQGDRLCLKKIISVNSGQPSPRGVTTPQEMRQVTHDRLVTSRRLGATWLPLQNPGHSASSGRSKHSHGKY